MVHQLRLMVLHYHQYHVTSVENVLNNFLLHFIGFEDHRNVN